MAYIAGVEHVYNNWPELVPQLMKNVTSSESTPQLKEASLEAIGYICEDLVSSGGVVLIGCDGYSEYRGYV